MEEPFGNILMQVFMGDFMQLNPVSNHTLLEALIQRTRVPRVPKKVSDEDKDGYSIFRAICDNVVVFSGTHRFLDADLPALLQIMRTPGGAIVPDALRKKVKKQIVLSASDVRLSVDYEQRGRRGFFAFGAKAAIQWEQVARLQQLHVVLCARASCGPHALFNKADGKPDVSSVAGRSLRPGQLVYYFQAVDTFRHKQHDRQIYLDALKFVNLSKSAGLQGISGFFVGMRVRLTKKIAPPELVQEATGEIIDIRFHPMERFGHPCGNPLRPPDQHDCWDRGWVLCDYLPMHIAVRWDGCSDDYTGLGQPGVWHLEPQRDSWDFPLAKVYTINHPNAARPVKRCATGKKKATVEVTRVGCALAPEQVVTFQNIQGQTVRGPQGEPKGFDVDLYRPSTMSGNDMAGEYFQHVYIALGRARRLDEVLIRNFPQLESGELDWSIFENGPPDYLVEFARILDEKAKRTSRKLLAVQGDLGMPAFDDLPECFSDGEGTGRFRYDAHAWSEACQVTASKRKKRSKTQDSGGHALPQLREMSVPQSATACLAGSAASKRKCEGQAGSAAKPLCEPPRLPAASPGIQGPAQHEQSLQSASPSDSARSAVVPHGPRKRVVGKLQVGWRCPLLGRRIGDNRVHVPDWCLRFA